MQNKNLTNPKIKPFNEKNKDLMNKRQADENENIDESEDLDERTISNQKKTALMQNNTVGRTNSNNYNFTNPTGELDQLPY